MNRCPNRAWSGCTHADHVFRYKKSFNKHIVKCEIARKQSECEEQDLRPLLKQVVKRLNELEKEVAVLKEDNRNLREQIRAPSIRGHYEVRGQEDTPTHGFAHWSADVFLKHLQATDDFYRARVGHSVLCRNFKEFVGAVCYVGNGNTNIVRISATATENRQGNPSHVDLNFRKRRRTVTLESAVKRLFEQPFLPTAEEIEDVLGPVPPGIKKSLAMYAHYLSLPPSKQHRDLGSWELKVELLMAIASYTVPKKEKRLTRAERADETFEREVKGEGRFWRYMDPDTLVDTYDNLLADSHQYVTLLREYLDTQPEKLQAYRDAGGIHADRLDLVESV